MRTTGGRTIESSETEFSLVTASKAVAVELNSDYYMPNNPAAVYSTINETNESISGTCRFSPRTNV